MSNMTTKKHPGAAFISDEGGSTAMIFGLAFVPIMLMLGATSDYTKYATTRTTLQAGTDEAVLKVATHPDMSSGNMSEATAKARLQVQLKADPRLSSATVVTTTISQDKQTLCATTSMQIRNSFMQMAQISTLTPQAKTCANLAWGVNPNTTYEIALVLDNSGSMNGGTSGTTKLGALKTAANSFVSTMFTKAPGKVEFSVTPFAGAVVAVDPTVATNRTLPWIDLLGLNSQHWIAFGGQAAATAAGFVNRFGIFDKLKMRNAAMDWRGCFEAPTYPRNVQDMAVSSGDPETLFVPYLAPDEPSKYVDSQGRTLKRGYSNNNYIDDNGGVTTSYGTTYTCTGDVLSYTASDWAKLTHVCKYKPTAAKSGSYGPTSFSGPNAFCPSNTTQTLMQLSNSQSAITNKIDQLVGNGNTNLHEGFMWGWRTISPIGPFEAGRAYNVTSNRKIMVFMTDGFNNWGSQVNTVVGSDYESFGYYTNNGQKNLRLADGTSGDGVDYQAALTASANTSTSYKPTSRNAQDSMTLEACTNAKTQGVEIFTIGFSTTDDPIDAQGLDLMRKCATNVDHYFAVENVAQLNTAFATIGVGIGKLRLSQ